MQNTTLLVLLRPIFVPKMKTVPQWNWRADAVQDLPLFGPEKWIFFCWISPKVGQKTDWISVNPFFFGDRLILTEKLPQSDSRLMKIWIKFVYCCFQLPKKPPPPMRIPGYAPNLFCSTYNNWVKLTFNAPLALKHKPQALPEWPKDLVKCFLCMAVIRE